jgi:hypothetical protein
MGDREAFLSAVADELPFDPPERGEILEELREHVADSSATLEADGISPEDAARIAVDRLGSAHQLAHDLTAARRSRRRLLAAAGAGSWAVVTSGIYGGIVGLFLAFLAWASTVWLVHFVGPFAFDTFSFVAVGTALYAAGSALIHVVAGRAGYRTDIVRRLLIPAGAILVTIYALVGWSGPLDAVGVAAVLTLPAWWILGSLRRTRFRRGSRRAFGVLFLVAACAVVLTEIGQMRLRDLEPRTAAFADASDMHLDRIAAPPLESIASLITGAGQVSAQGSAGISAGTFVLDISDATGFAAWRDLRVEAWRAIDPGSSPGATPVSARASGPFVVAPAVWSPPGELPGGSMRWSSSEPWGPNAMTLSGSVRLDRTPGITAAWVALTGVAPDGSRHLIGDPNYVEATFTGTALDWLRAAFASASREP